MLPDRYELDLREEIQRLYFTLAQVDKLLLISDILELEKDEIESLRISRNNAVISLRTLKRRET